MLKTFLLPFLLTVELVCGQTQDSLLNRIIKKECEGSDPASLYLHVDKSIFTKGENIWFTSYNLSDSANVLHVVLANRIKGTVALFDRFAIVNGIGHGYLFLPDTLDAGEYMLIAYTDNFPSGVFRQPISIKSVKKALLNVATRLEDSVLTCNVSLPEGGLAVAAGFFYRLYNGNKLVKQGQTETNNFGEVSISLPPSCMNGKVTLLAHLKMAARTLDVAMPILTGPDNVTVEFFPEGGNIVANHVCRLGLELKTLKGMAVSVEGCLLEDSNCISAFRTDVYGRGYLDFIPKPGKSYTIYVEDHNNVVQTFPPIAGDGYTMHAKKGLVNDSLLLEIYSSKVSNDCIVMVHSANALYNCVKLSLHNNQGRAIIPCNTFPAGPAIVTLFDGAGNFQCERNILISHGEKTEMHIEMDSSVYHKRSKVTATIKVVNEKGEPVKTAFSLSSIFAKRLDVTKSADINYIGNFDNNRQLETMLIMQKRNVPKISSTWLPTDVFGKITHNGKKLSAPVSLILFGSKISFLYTDSTGNFVIPLKQQVDSADKKVSIRLVNPAGSHNTDAFLIATLEPDYRFINDSLANIFYPFDKFEKDTLSVEERNNVSKTLPEAKVLATVTVTASDKDFGTEFYSKTCNDWVCPFNILNCRNHPFGRTPIDGEMYQYNGRTITYHGCKVNSPLLNSTSTSLLKSIRAIHLSKDFFLANYAKFNPPDPEVNTTICWIPEITTNDKGEATISFYTNDLTGRFCIVAEGVSTSGTVSGKQYFRVTDE